MKQAIEGVLDFFGQFTDSLDNGKGMFVFASLIFLAFVIFSFVNNTGLHAPGIYFFGVIVPAGLYLRASIKYTEAKYKTLSYILTVLVLILSVLDTVRRVYG